MAQKFTITAELNLQTKNIGQVVDNLKKQFQGADLNIKIKDLAKAESQMRGLSKTTGEAERSVSSLGGSIATAAKKFSAITLATGTLVGFTRAIKNAVSDAIEFEREIVKIAQATGKTVSQLKGLQNEVSSVASSLGVSSKELILAARSLTQAGFAADKVTGALRVLAQTEVAATFDSISDTTEGAIALLNQFGRAAQRTGSEVEFLEKSLSAINQVSKDFAVESSDLITAVRTTGSAFESAGGSLNELLALFTSVRSTTRESAESIATGFRTIFTRVQRVDTINALRNLGIELQDVEGKFVGPMEATKRLSTALSTIDPRDFRFNLIVEELGGFRQVSKVIPLIQQFAVAQKALNVAQNSSGSLAKDAATAQQALSVQIAKTKENFQAFVRELVDSSSFQNTIKSLLTLADSFIRVADTIKPIIPLIAGFAALKVGQALGSSFLSVTGASRNKKANGGKVHAFASGGLVPGQGNGDTVPAMLTPGEFVIKKSSVKKLGANKLAGINKYADGGYVIRPKSGAFAGFFMQPEGSGADDTSLVSEGLSVSNKAVKSSLLEQINKNKSSYKAKTLSKKDLDLLKQQAIDDYTPQVKTITGAIENNIFKQEDYKNYISGKKTADSLIPEGYNPASRGLDITTYAAKSLINNLKNEKDKFNKYVESKSITEGITGSTQGTEIKIAAKSGDVPAFYIGSDDGPRSQQMRSAISKETQQGFKSIISNIGQDKAFKGIGIPPLSISAQSIQDATDSLFGSDQSARSTIEGYILEGISSALTGIKLGGDKTTWDFPNIAGSGEAADRLSKLFGNKDTIKSVISGDAKRSNTDKAKSSILATKIATTMAKDPNYIGSVSNFANGGFASGSDTVPAMLTPGEFIVNKKSAQAIGYSSLNRMNKVGKFAAGGPVGMQAFAAGGDVVSRTVQTARLNKFLSGPGKSALSAIDPKEAIKVVDVLRKIAEGGRDIPKALKYVEEQIKQQGANFKLDYKGLSQAVKAPKETPSIKLSEQLKDLSDNTSKTSSNLLIMASVAESVVAQMSGLSDELKSGLSAFGATFATYKVIGDNLKNLGIDIYIASLKRKEEQIAIDAGIAARAKETAAIVGKSAVGGAGGDQSAAKFAKTMQNLNIAATGLSAVFAISAATTAYFSKIAEKSGKELDKTLDEFRKNPEQVGRQGLASKYQTSIKDASRANFLEKNNSFQNLAGGAAVGAAIGTAILPGLGTAIGAVTGALGAFAKGIYKTEKDLQTSFNNIKMASNSLSSSMYTSIVGIKNAQKFIENIEKKTNPEVFAEVTSATNEYADSIREANQAELAAIAMFGRLEDAPESFRRSVETAREATQAFSKELDNIIAAQYSRQVKEINSNLNSKDFNPLAEIGSFVRGQMENIAKRTTQEVEGRYRGQIEFLKSGGGQTDIIGQQKAREAGAILERDTEKLAILQGTKAMYEMEKALIDDTLQLIRQKEALIEEDAVRQKLVGTLIEQLSLESALKNFEYSIKKADNTLSQIGAAFNGSVSGLKSRTPDSSVLDSIIPNASNMADYQNALKVIASIGPAGQKIADNFKDLNKVVPNFKAKMAASDDFRTGKLDKNQIEKFVTGLGIDANGEVGKEIQKMIQRAVAPAEGGGPRDPAEIQKRIGEELDKYAEMLRGSGKRILDAITANEQSTAKAYDEINASRQRQLDLQMQSIDGYEKLVKNVAAAQGRTLSLIEKNNLRFNRQRLLAGNMAGNPAAIGRRLGEIRGKLGPDQVGNLNADQRANLQNEAGKLTQALKELADQSGRTADTLEEIEKIKAQREAVKDAAKEYTFGGVEERAKLEQSVQALTQVMATGNIDSIPDELKAGVQSLLERFKDVPMFNGMTGKQVENKLIANKMRDIGAFDAANMIEADTSTPEQKLTQELYRIAAEEQAARQQLFNQEAQQQAMQMDVINKNTLALQQLSIDLQAEKAKLDQQQQAGVNELGAKKEKEQLAAQKKELEERRKFIDEELKATNESIKTLINTITNISTALNNAIAQTNADLAKQAQIAQGLRVPEFAPPFVGPPEPFGFRPPKNNAKGGLIYAAKGQLINFEPKGTDTVPAMLSPGEFVMRKAAVQKYGGGMMKAINAGRFAKGGTVGYYAEGGSSEPYSNRLIDYYASIRNQKPQPTYDFNPAKQQSSMTEQTKLLSFLVRLKDIGTTNLLLSEIINIIKGLKLNNISSNRSAPSVTINNNNPLVDKNEKITKADLDKFYKSLQESRDRRNQVNQQQQQFQQGTRTGFDTSGTVPSPGSVIPNQMAIRRRAVKATQANQSKNPAKKTKPKPLAPLPNTWREELLMGPYAQSQAPVERDAQGKKVRPKNSMYTQEQWDAMQKKADDEKKLSDARAKALEEEIARDIADNGKRASGVGTVDPRNQKTSPRDRITKRYGQRPKIFPTDEAWFRYLKKKQDTEDTTVTQDLTKRSQKSNEKRGTSDYGKPSTLPPGRSQATQDAIDKAKELQKSADALRKRQTGLNPGERYQKPSDVPVLTPSKHGTAKPMTPAELDAMEKEAEKAVFSEEELLATQDKALRKMKEDANKVHRNMKKQYEGKDAYSRYLNALGKLNAANMMRKKYSSKPADQTKPKSKSPLVDENFFTNFPDEPKQTSPLVDENFFTNFPDEQKQTNPPEPQTPPASPFVEKPKELLDQEKKTAEEAKKAVEEAKKKAQAAAAAAQAQEEARKNQERAAKEAQDSQKKAEETAKRKAELDKAAQKAREDELEAEKSFVGPPESYTQKKVEPPKEEPYPTFEETMKDPLRQQMLGPKNGPFYEYNLKIAKDQYEKFKAADEQRKAAKATEEKRKQEQEAAAKKEADRQKALNDSTEEDARRQNALDKQKSNEKNRGALLPPVRPLPTPEPPKQSTAPSTSAPPEPTVPYVAPTLDERAKENDLTPERQVIQDYLISKGEFQYVASIGSPGGPTWRDAFRKAGNLKRQEAADKRFRDRVQSGKVQGFNSGGFVNYLARGGSPIFKPKGTDTVPAMLSPGEYVIRKSAVDKIGVDALHSINNTGRPRMGAIPKKNEVKVNKPTKPTKAKPTGMLQGAQKHPGGTSGFGIGPMGGGGYGGMGTGGGFGGFGGYGYGAPLVSYNTYNGQPFGSLGMQQAQNWYMGQYYQNFVQKPNMWAQGNSNIMNSLMGNYMNNYSQGRNSFLQKMFARSRTHMNWNRNFNKGGKVNYRAAGGKMSGTMGIGGYAGVDDMIGTGLGNLSVPFLGGFGYGTPLVQYDTYNGQPFGSLSMQEAQNWYMGQYNQQFIQKPAMWAQGNSNALAYLKGNYMNNYAQGHNNYMSNIWAKGGRGGGFTHNIPKFASGGSVGEDTVPAMLTPGEFVMNKNAVDKHGMNFMDHLNRGGKVQGFATGGPVYRAVGGSMGGGSGGVSMSNVGVSIDLSAISTTISNSIGAAFSKVGSLISPSAITQIVSSFSSFIQSMNNMLSKVSGMQMTHTVNISGGISVTGINSQAIANVVSGAVTEEVANLVRSEVMRQFNQIMNQAKSE